MLANIYIRIKSCFYDFIDDEKKPSAFPLALSVGLFLLCLIAFFSAQHLVSSHVISQYVFDEETRSLIVGNNSNVGLSVERISFDDITKIEHVIGGKNATYEIVAVLRDGKRLIVRQSRDSLSIHAENISRNIKVPYSSVNNTRIGRD